jgi:hypothetical protein
MDRHVSMDDYRAWGEVSNSDLKNMKRSPAFAHYRRSHPFESKATAFGTAVHTAVLEPHLLDQQYQLEPQQPADNAAKVWRSTKAYKEARAEMIASGGLTLTMDEFDSCHWIRDNVAKDPIGEMIAATAGGTEWSVKGEGRKIRPDVLCPTANSIVDLKTSSFSSRFSFAKQAYDLGYYMGAPYYLDCMGMEENQPGVFDHYVFLVIPTDQPHEVYTYTLDSDSMEQGRHDYRRLLAQWRECEANSIWPAGPGAIQEIRIPQYGIDFHMEG